MGETRQRSRSDEGGKKEGTQALGAKCSPPPLCPQSKKSQKESSLDLSRQICWLPKGCQVPRSLDKSGASSEASYRVHSCPVSTGRLSSWLALSRMLFRILRRYSCFLTPCLCETQQALCTPAASRVLAKRGWYAGDIWVNVKNPYSSGQCSLTLEVFKQMSGGGLSEDV